MMAKKQKIPLDQIINLNLQTEDVKICRWQGKKVLQNGSGHNSFFLRKPIIEGKFYVEMVGHMPLKMLEHLKYPPNFRVGLVPTEYYYNYPLGQAHSIAYKTDGSIITNSGKILHIENYKFQDHIGIGINIVQVFKDRRKDKLAPKNSVCFFKNGIKVSEDLHILTQDLFSFAGSLYNGAVMEVLYEKTDIKFLPQDFRPYGEHLREKILYKDNEMKSFELDFMNTFIQ